MRIGTSKEREREREKEGERETLSQGVIYNKALHKASIVTNATWAAISS